MKAKGGGGGKPARREAPCLQTSRTVRRQRDLGNEKGGGEYSLPPCGIYTVPARLCPPHLAGVFVNNKPL